MALLSSKTGLPSFTNDQTSFINYFTDGGFERGTNGVIPAGWSQYNDGTVAIPIDGTGTGPGLDATVTMLCSNSSPIRGALSAVITKPAGNKQGIGFSFPFTISQADKGFTAGVEFDMDTDALFAAGDVVFYVYDVTNSILITPRNVSIPKLDNFGRFVSDYGLTAGTSYRFILHIATGNTSAWTLKLDTMVNTTTRVAVPGPIITDPVSYPVVWSSDGTQPVLGNGTLTGTWRRSASLAEVDIDLTIGSTTTLGTSFYKFSLPPDFRVDGVNGRLMGVAQIYQNSSTGNTCSAFLNTVVSNDVYLVNSSGGLITNAAPFVLASGNRIKLQLKFPVTIWAGSGSVFGPSSQLEYLSTPFSSLIPYKGSDGTALPTTTPAGTNEQLVLGAQPWNNAAQLTDSQDMEVQVGGIGPFLPLPCADILPLTFDGTNYLGLGFGYSAGNYFIIRGKFRTYGSGTWATMVAGTRYRIKKANPTAPVGVSIAGTDGSPGYYKAGQAPGYTGGAAIPALYIGEKIPFTTRSVTISSIATWTANGSALATLTAGVWLITSSADSPAASSTPNYYGALIATNSNNDASGNVLDRAGAIVTPVATTVINTPTFALPIGFLIVPAGATQALYAKGYSEDIASGSITVYGFAVRIA